MSMHLIVTGPKGAGKSTHLLKLGDLLRENHKTLGGVISRGFWKDGEREGYEIVNPATGDSRILALKTKPLEGESFQFCSYSFSRSAFAEGNRWIRQGLEAEFLFIDEVGNLEMTGGGWDLRPAMTRRQPVILGVREDTVPKLEASWGIQGPLIRILPGVDRTEEILNLLSS